MPKDTIPPEEPDDDQPSTTTDLEPAVPSDAVYFVCKVCLNTTFHVPTDGTLRRTLCPPCMEKRHPGYP